MSIQYFQKQMMPLTPLVETMRSPPGTLWMHAIGDRSQPLSSYWTPKRCTIGIVPFFSNWLEIDFKLLEIYLQLLLAP
jgi:hypothetical protein